MSEMRLDVPIRYRTVKGWSGKRYQIRMTEKEIQARRILGLVASVAIGIPAWIIVMAIAAGLI